MRKYVLILIGMIFICGHVIAARNLVEISVEITEVNNNKATNLGINWLSAINVKEEGTPSILDLGKIGDIKRTTDLTAQLKFLQENGAAQVLSKPKVVTKVGTKAKIHVGGEFPVVASGGTGGTGAIEWKSYGIKLEIVPKAVNKNNDIDLMLNTEVSRLDWANQVQEVPAVTTRSASSNVEVQSGKTISIGGLIETKDEVTRAVLPVLSKLPILGYLFSYKSKRKEKTTILIFVTPKLL